MFEQFIFLIMRKTNNEKIKKDYEWVIRVLKSSKNYNHIVVTDRMVNNFFYKWRMDLTEKSIIEFKGQYLKEKKMVLGNF